MSAFMSTLLPLAAIAFYGVLLLAAVIFVQAVVRISYSFEQISRALEEMALALRAKSLP